MIENKKEYMRRWHIEYPNYRKKYMKKWYIKHPDCKERYNKNRRVKRHKLDISKKYIPKYGGEPKGEPKRESKQYHREYMKLWREINPKKAKQQRKFYKYNKKMAGLLTIKIIQLVYENNIKEFGTLTCIYCLNPIQFGKDHLEHIIPLTRNGTNAYENLAIACEFCNISKGNKLLEEWIKI